MTPKLILPVVLKTLSNALRIQKDPIFIPMALVLRKEDSAILVIPLILPHEHTTEKALLHLAAKQGSPWVCVLTGARAPGLWQEVEFEKMTSVHCSHLTLNGELIESWEFPISNRCIQGCNCLDSHTLN